MTNYYYIFLFHFSIFVIMMKIELPFVCQTNKIINHHLMMDFNYLFYLNFISNHMEI